MTRSLAADVDHRARLEARIAELDHRIAETRGALKYVRMLLALAEDCADDEGPDAEAE